MKDIIVNRSLKLIILSFFIASFLPAKIVRIVNETNEQIKISIHYNNGNVVNIVLDPDSNEVINSEKIPNEKYAQPIYIHACILNTLDENFKAQRSSNFKGSLQFTIFIKEDVLYIMPGMITDD